VITMDGAMMPDDWLEVEHADQARRLLEGSEIYTASVLRRRAPSRRTTGSISRVLSN